MEFYEFKFIEEGIKVVFLLMEVEIMEFMWCFKVVIVGQVYEELKRKYFEIRRLIVSILMNRLCEKGLLKRMVECGRGGMRYVYLIIMIREEFEQKVVKSILDVLMNNFREVIYVYFLRMKK